MHKDRQRIAARSIAARDDINRAALVGRVAGREVRDAAAGVPVPGTGAKLAGRRFNVCDGHIRSSVREERPIGVMSNRLRCPLAVGRDRSTDLAYLRKVQRNAEYLWAQRNGRHLTHGYAGVSAI